jgi:hypothetical protein
LISGETELVLLTGSARLDRDGANVLDGGAFLPHPMMVGNDRLVFTANCEPPRGQHIPCGRPVGWNTDTVYGFIKEATEIED